MFKKLFSITVYFSMHHDWLDKSISIYIEFPHLLRKPSIENIGLGVLMLRLSIFRLEIWK